MIEIDSPSWYIFLLIAAAVILFFIWRFLNETKRIQEKMKGMKSFSDIIDAVNQALDEFNTAFDEAGKVIEKRRDELSRLVTRAEEAAKKLEILIEKVPKDIYGAPEPIQPVKALKTRQNGGSGTNGDRVEDIKKYLASGKSYEEISRLTGASIREVKLVEKFSGGANQGKRQDTLFP